MDGLITGRIVHYVMTNDDCPGRENEHRAAIVTNTFPYSVVASGAGHANMHVFWDDMNDASKQSIVYKEGVEQGPQYEYKTPPDHKYSVPYSEEPKPGTWHWIERT